MEKQSPEKVLLTVPEAAAACGYSRAHLYNAINRGEIPAIRLGRTTRIPRLWLDKWISSKVSEWEDARAPQEPAEFAVLRKDR